MDWLRWFNFTYDPFFDKPLETETELETLLVISQSLKERMKGFITQLKKIPQICLVVGERGVGKSTAMYYGASLSGKNGGFPVYVGLNHTRLNVSGSPMEEIKRDLLENILTEIIKYWYSYHREMFQRNKNRLIRLMNYLGYSYDFSIGFFPDIEVIHLNYTDIVKQILDLIKFLNNNGFTLLLLIDNLDKVKNMESVQNFLGSAFGQTFFHNLRRSGASIMISVAPKFLKIQKADRDLNYLSKTIIINPIIPNQAIDLIQKRIDYCKTPFPKNPFTKDAIIHICLSKQGITRDILTESRNLCMKAGRLEVSKIKKEFVESGLISFNPNRIFYDLMESGETNRDNMMKLLKLQTLLNQDDCVKAGSVLQSIVKEEVKKIPYQIHAALLELGIIQQKIKDIRKYTFTSQIEQLLKVCEKKGWNRGEFLRWITSTEGHDVAEIGKPGMRASQSLENFGPFPEPLKSFVSFRIRNTEKTFSTDELMFDAKMRLSLAKKTMKLIGKLSWDDIDSKTVYLDLYTSLIHFLVAFSKLYLSCFTESVPRVRSINRFDLISAINSILQKEREISISSWHRILRFRANIMGIKEGQFSPSHAELKTALDDFEVTVNEFSSVWRDILSEVDIVPKPPDRRTENAIAKLANIASILRYSLERPEYRFVEVDGEIEYLLGFSTYPTNSVLFDVVREKQIKDAEGKVVKSFIIAKLHPIQKGKASSTNIVGFLNKCNMLINVIENKEESLTNFWPRYYLIFVSLKGFERGITATLTSSEKPPRSKVNLLDFNRLESLEKDLEYTFRLGRAEGAFEEMSSRSLEELLRIRIKAAEAIRDRYRKETTILLADLKEFTQRTEEDSIEAAEAVQKLSDIFDKYVIENDGNGTQTEGDSYIAYFDKAENAIKAAISTLEELKEYNKIVESQKQIFIRIGINSGYAIFKKGQPFVGSVVNLASRAMRRVEAGQIAVTYYTKDKIKSKKGFRFKSLGQKKMKGVDRLIELFEVQRE